MNTRGRVEDEILGFFNFFTFLLEKVQTRENLFFRKPKYLFPFPRQTKTKWGDRIATKKEAALQRLRRNNKNKRVCVYVCVFISSDTNKRETTTRKLSYI